MSSKRPELEPPYLFAFLRAVNLGRHNKVPMKTLMELMENEDFPPAAFLLASGNLVFGSTRKPTRKLSAGLARLIEKEFGVKTAAVFRTSPELRLVTDGNPFVVSKGGSVHVALWNTSENVSADARRDLAAADFTPDRLELGGDAAYLRFASSSHDSRLNNSLIERRLGVVSTARNINTFERLLQRWPPDS